MKLPPFVSRLLADYGMVLVLLLLAAFFSVVTWAEQHPTGAEGADDVARQLGGASRVLVVVGAGPDETAFADRLKERLPTGTVVATAAGDPREARKALGALAKAGGTLDAVACTPASAAWEVLDPATRKADFPSLAAAKLVSPRSHRWPNFLKRENLVNVAAQIVVIAILAVGMTFVIITGGIDLSAGSLIALSSVVAARLIRDAGGGEQAGMAAMALSCLAAVAACAAVGFFSGTMVTVFSIPPFITTLAMMLVASGLAFHLAQGQSINQVPPGFVTVGRGTTLGLPNGVILMALLYATAHVLMSRTALGRYVYAVGGNSEAAWLSGVPVRRVLLFAYTAAGALAGLGGIVLASQLKSGAPTYGLQAELATIAAVVVGGASLSGGEGRILGTLIGAFIMGVIQNGMNLTGIQDYTQKVVLGLVILGAVLLDTLKRRGGAFLRRAKA